ncbi:MAG: prolyl oligopeptidase family serine peptidase, partial [Alphaproteobacteria bacterium]
RFADMSFDPERPRLLTVAERHGNGHAPTNLLVTIDLRAKTGAGPRIFTQGHDFYASPSFSPDGRRAAWLAWNLPHMPWEAAQLWVGDIGEDGTLVNSAPIAGGGGKAGNAFQPEWAADGALYFVADHQGWGNIFRWRDGVVTQITKCMAEFGRPQWVFGMRSFALLSNDCIFAAPLRDGRLAPCLIDTATGAATRLDIAATRLDNCAAGAGILAALTASDTQGPSVEFFDQTGATLAGAQRPVQLLSAADISVARVLEIPVGENPIGETIFALYYPPSNAACHGPQGEPPPMMVLAHGGPTGQAKRGLDLKIQFWTQRGFAVLDVDYRGSFGYGAAYVEALNGHWGALDAEDVVASAKYCANAGLADAGAMVISGSSAGGLTVLNALAGSDVFAAGASYYGVADLAALAADTHKFESGYLTALVGADLAVAAEIYRKRSPINRADTITAPVIFFQGLDDKVVPPSQSRAMAASLRARAVQVALHEFVGEGHGFRRSKTIITALEAELEFYRQVLFGES